MPNTLFNLPDTPGLFDRQILVASQSQPVAAANPGRTYWCVEKLDSNDTIYVSLGAPRDDGAGAHKLDRDCRAIDSSVVPELTQAAIYIWGNYAGGRFTFEEVAAAQSAQS